MDKSATKNNGIKDCISKLFILRDSCMGTCIAQKENPHIIWFEGAAVLLQQGVDKLKSAQVIIDKGGNTKSKDFSTNVKGTLSKLVVLKRSWIVSSSEETDENVIWFEGAESIISEVIEQLQNVLKKSEPQAKVSQAPGSSASGQSTDADTEDDSKSSDAEEESEDEDSGDEELKAAAV